jgi:DNA-directed RNA polymerase specialized sigma24 family protein
MLYQLPERLDIFKHREHDARSVVSGMDKVYGLNYQELEDLELLSKISDQDRDALATLYERYGRRVFAIAVRMLNDPIGSEEVTQDVFMSVWRRGASYTSKKGKFTTWLFSIAHNRTIDELRKRRRDRSRENDDIDDHLNIKSGDISPQMLQLLNQSTQRLALR